MNIPFRFGTFTINKQPIKDFLRIVEVGPRDGLQNELKCLSISERALFIQKCQSIGLLNIEVGSFVNSKKIPQLANTDQVLSSLDKKNGYYSVITPNMKGIIDASKYKDKIDEVVFIISTSDSFNKKNIGSIKADMWKKYSDCAKIAKENGWKIRGSISCSFGCPIEGHVSETQVFDCITEYLNLGVDYIDIADTIGIANPSQVTSLFTNLFRENIIINKNMLAGHFHDSNNLASKNILAAYETGVKTFHSSISGIGGCPFSPTRVGNISTEKLIKLCNDHNIIPISQGTNNISSKLILQNAKDLGLWIKNILQVKS